MKTAKDAANACAGLATSGNYAGRTSRHNSTNGQDLAAFRRRLAAFLLHEPVRLLSVREVAQLLAVSTPIVYGLCERAQVRHARVGNAIRIPLDALVEFLEGGRW